MTTIDEILKYAEHIGKEPGVEQEQQTINKLKIAMRFAVTKAQEWISVENDPPHGEWINVKNESSYATMRIAGDVDLKFLRSNFTHWRLIEIK